MGSGHSKTSQVHSFQTEQGNGGAKGDRRSSKDEAKDTSLQRSKSLTSKQDITKEQNPASDEALTDAQEKIKQLEKQLGESESEKLDLQDLVEGLQGQLDYVQSMQTIVEEPEDLTKTVHAKDKLIDTLEREKEIQQSEFNKMKSKCRKRIKMLSTKLSEAKQETSIQLFELRDEITRFQEENEKLRDKQRSSSGTKDDSGIQDFEKMKIVLELSNQVSDQSEQIAKLEDQLTEKNLIIEKLMSSAPMTKSSSKLIVQDHNTEMEDHEEEVNQTLKKLSLGLSQYKVDVGSKTNATDDENRGFSGASRDSGIGSAGKNGRKLLVPTNSKVSTLSDESDWDSDTPSMQSKVRSAPPESKSKRSTPRLYSASSNRTNEDNEEQTLTNSNMSKKSEKLSFLQKRFRMDKVGSAKMAFEKEISSGDGFTKDSHFFMTQSSTPTGSDADSLYAM